MTIPSPILDDSSYEQLRSQLVSRIPFYNPEWTDHNASDPGITLLELFAYLSEHVLFRFNQIPEKTYLEYLQLLQIDRLPAYPAQAMVELSTDKANGVQVEKQTQLSAGDVRFESLNTVSVWPFKSIAVSKAPVPLPEPGDFAYVENALTALNVLAENTTPVGYQNQLITVAEGQEAINLSQAVDKTLWVAVLNDSKLSNQEILTGLHTLVNTKKPSLIINIGFVPDDIPQQAAAIDPCPGPDGASNARPVQWQVTTEQLIDQQDPIYKSLKVVADTTYGLTEEGVLRLEITSNNVGNFDFVDEDMAGAGDFPPVLDEEENSKVLFWLRAFRLDDSTLGSVRQIAINAIECVQAVTARPEFLGTGNAQPGQNYKLSHSPVIADSLVLEIENYNGWQAWQEVDGFHGSFKDDRHYILDRVGGVVTFGPLNVPQIGQRIRARSYRYGGGRIGNVAAEAVTKIASVSGVKVTNALPARGGSDDESIDAALDRIPAELRRRDRAVTPGDFRELALMTPGADISRAETLELYRPRTGEQQAAGVVSVVIWPNEDPNHPNAPIPTRKQLDQVCRHLDSRRLVTTEVYVIPPEYLSVAISVGIEIKSGFAIDSVRSWVELIVRQYLAPLPPFGPEAEGWPLNSRLSAPELEAIVSQVEGVKSLAIDDINRGLRIKLFDVVTETWNEPPVIVFVNNQLPEVLAITVVEGPPLDPEQALSPKVDSLPVPIPVEVEEC